MDTTQDKLDKIIEMLEGSTREFYNHDELMKLFDLSDSTIRRMRDEGLLGFSQPSKHCYIYKKSDVEKLLSTTYHKPFALKRTTV